MPAAIAIVGIVVLVSWLKMSRKDQDATLGVNQK